MKVAAKKKLQDRGKGGGGNDDEEGAAAQLGHKLATFPRVGLVNLCGATS